MSIKNVEENLMDFSSPLNTEKVLTNETNSPGSNPFDTIMNIAETFKTTDFERELFEPRNIDIDCGRESLGILHVDFEKLKFDDINWLNIPNIQVNNETVSPIDKVFSPNVFNAAFLYSSTYSNISNIKSSLSSLPDTLKSWDVSKVSFFNSLDNSTNINSASALNKAFIEFGSKIKYNGTDCLFQNGVNCFKQRLHSLPDVLDHKAIINEISITHQNSNIESFKGYCRKFRKSDSLLKQSFTLPQILKSTKKENDKFEDSVFMEANYIATKIADGTIYDMDDDQLCSLHDTTKPEWLDMCDDILDEDVPKISTEKIFETLDKVILPINSEDIPENIPNISKISSNSSSSSSLSRNECVQSLTDIFNGDAKKLSSSRLSQGSNNSKSKDAQSILQNLSVILNNDNPSVQQKTEGQNLLFSLADILCANDVRNSSYDRDQSEDSGHSSIEQDVLATNKQDYMNNDALDLRINSTNSPDKIKPLDLSISKKSKTPNGGEVSIDLSKSNVANKNLSNTSKYISVQEDKTNNESTYSNNSRNISHVKTNIPELPSFTKLKPKKTSKNLVSEKGPLKATIPLGNMSKPKGINGSNRISSTPPKYGQSAPVYQIKCTSTPKTETKLQPVAQSTPEGNSDIIKRIPISSNLKQRKSDGLTSPLTRTKSINNNSINEVNKKNRSGSAPDLSSSCNNVSTRNSSEIMFRRRSASDLKLPKNSAKFKRSNTIDKDTGISKTLSRVRENIEKARKIPLAGTKAVATTTNSGQNKTVLAERNRSSTSSNIKPCNLVHKLKRSNGKENSVS